MELLDLIVRLVLIISAFAVLLTGCESNRKEDITSDEDELTRLLNLAEHVELTVAGDSCLQYYLEALKLAENHDKPETQINIHIHLGNNYLSFEEYNKAQYHFQRSLQISKKHPKLHEATVDALDWNGLYHGYIKNYDSSLYYFQKGLAYGIQNLSNNHEMIGNSYLSIAWHYGDIRKNYETALKYIEKALKIRTEIFGEDSGEAGECYLQMAKWNFVQADYNRAIEYMEKASRSFEKVLPPDSEAVLISYNYLGEYYLAAGFEDKAKSIYQKIVNTSENKENKSQIAKGKLGLAICYSKIDPGKTERLFKLAIEKHSELYDSASDNFINLYHELGKFYTSMEMPILGKKYLEKCESIILGIYGESSVKYAEINLSLAQLYLAQRDWKNSKIVSQKALKIYEENTKDLVKPGVIFAYRDLGIAHLKDAENIKDLQKSFDFFQKSLESIERLKKNYSNDLAKEKISTQIAGIFSMCIDLAFRLYQKTNDHQYKHKVFEIAEKSRSFILLSEFVQSKAKEFSNIPADLLSREKSLKNEITFYSEQVYSLEQEKSNDPQKLIRLKDELFKYTLQLDQLVKELKDNYPEYNLNSNDIEYLTINEIRNEVKSDEVILEYYISLNHIYILYILKDSYEVIQIEKSDDFVDDIRKLSIAVNKYQNNDFIEHSGKLYKKILLPVANVLPAEVHKLKIIPDGELNLISFDYLITNEDSVSNLTEANYLIEDFTITYHHSVSLAYKEQNLLAENKSILLSAPLFNSKNDYHLKPLPMSEKESKTIARIAKENSYRTDLVLSDKATENYFKQNASNYSIIHLATHTEVDKNNNQYSNIYFFPTPNEKENGKLTLAETYNLKMNPSLITLSSCESGVGDIVKGEGMISFSRGFTYSGAQNVIFSLWKVNDKFTSDTMAELYRQILSGSEYNAALREAKLKTLKSYQSLSPKDWAGFILIEN